MISVAVCEIVLLKRVLKQSSNMQLTAPLLLVLEGRLYAEAAESLVAGSAHRQSDEEVTEMPKKEGRPGKREYSHQIGSHPENLGLNNAGTVELHCG